MRSRSFSPPADLADVVEKCWTASWELPPGEPHETQLLSDPCMHIAFERGGKHAGARLVGVWTRLWTRQLEGVGLVRAVKLRAGAGRVFWQMPAGQCANRIVALSQVVRDDSGAAPRQDIKALERAVVGGDNEEEAFEHLCSWLRKARSSTTAQGTALAIKLVEQVLSDSDITQVAHLAEASGISSRRLQRLFRDHVGAPPKWVIRRNRLQEVAARITRGEVSNLTHLAAELGYSDHAHLAHDFKSVTGKTPTELAKQSATYAG